MGRPYLLAVGSQSSHCRRRPLPRALNGDIRYPQSPRPALHSAGAWDIRSSGCETAQSGIHSSDLCSPGPPPPSPQVPEPCPLLPGPAITRPRPPLPLSQVPRVPQGSRSLGPAPAPSPLLSSPDPGSAPGLSDPCSSNPRSARAFGTRALLPGAWPRAGSDAATSGAGGRGWSAAMAR